MTRVRKPGIRRVNSDRPNGGRFDYIERQTYYAAIRRLLEQNLSDNTIAEQLGISNQTVYRYRHQHDIANSFGIRPSQITRKTRPAKEES